jgi:LAO/AO transport system kinase
MNLSFTEKIIQGDFPTAARLIRDIDDGVPSAIENLKRLYPHTGKAHIIGITGSPGVGKSTLVNALISAFRKRAKTIGVVCIDPTSPYTGGAILGDRIRMQKHNTDPDVFIRSIGTRGKLGGLSTTTMNIVNVMDAMGKDIVLVETVGIGQAEVGIAQLADTTVYVLTPAAGDSIQMIKAGIIEAADIFIINKADLDNADIIKSDLVSMTSLISREDRNWQPSVFLAEAVRGKGISEIIENIDRHWSWLTSSKELEKRRRTRTRLELIETIESNILGSIRETLNTIELENLVETLLKKQSDPHSVANEVINRCIKDIISKRG